MRTRFITIGKGRWRLTGPSRMMLNRAGRVEVDSNLNNIVRKTFALISDEAELKSQAITNDVPGHDELVEFIHRFAWRRRPEYRNNAPLEWLKCPNRMELLFYTKDGSAFESVVYGSFRLPPDINEFVRIDVRQDDIPPPLRQWAEEQVTVADQISSVKKDCKLLSWNITGFLSSCSTLEAALNILPQIAAINPAFGKHVDPKARNHHTKVEAALEAAQQVDLQKLAGILTTAKLRGIIE